MEILTDCFLRDFKVLKTASCFRGTFKNFVNIFKHANISSISPSADINGISEVISEPGLLILLVDSKRFFLVLF